MVVFLISAVIGFFLMSTYLDYRREKEHQKDLEEILRSVRESEKDA